MANAKIIDGKAKAAELSEAIKARTARLIADKGVKPGLAVVIVGEDPASEVYVRNKKRTAEACGFHSVQHSLPADSTEDAVLRLVNELNEDPAIHGILVQLPLPGHLDEQTVTQAIVPEKDVDGFHFQNIGMLTAGHLEGAFVPCTPAGCMLMIEDQLGKDLSGLNAVIIGRSKMVKGDWIKPGAVVIDVGINRIEVEADGEKKNRLVGDVDFDEAVRTAGAITPVPGGVGPMTIIMLMSNTLDSAARRA